MKITKFGHCCLLIEEAGVRILTDPGSFTREAQEALTGLDAVLYTHEHSDHFHLASLKTILARNPGATVLCNASVGALLEQEGIAHTIIAHGERASVRGLSIEGFGDAHAPIHPMLPPMHNTGYFIGGELWYPGDAFVDPGKHARLLALPVAGPWMKTQEAIDYALALKPGTAFPVHDGILAPALLRSGAIERWYGALLDGRGITFTALELGREYDL